LLLCGRYITALATARERADVSQPTQHGDIGSQVVTAGDIWLWLRHLSVAGLLAVNTDSAAVKELVATLSAAVEPWV
jgi:hypothetical protein